ncbi:DUF748 domain-containing protein [Sulfurimonas sp. HSL-3221]|uniref:DUF748 domain-containing protein n=1 Tax=Thiomicrolovo sulfuroxydans TaxID=2894755 RepID=UPI001E2C965E|nr:DUF748 domain-containing protein [Sulfurimonas sp. HSL-3221]UFS62665.1 DUF748 domain-containing protein [Sulfurimonas sp. HSL-3221]
MKRWIWRTLLGVIALYLLTAVIAVPYLIRTKVPELVGEMTGGSLEIDRALFNPFILDLTVEGIRFADPEGAPLASLRRLDVNVDVLHLIWGEISVEYFGLRGLRLSVVQERDGRFNFDWLTHLGSGDAAETAPAETNGSAMPSLRLETFELEDGGITFTDLSRPVPLQLDFSPIGLDLHDIDTGGGGENELHLFAHTEEGGLLDVKSRVHSFEPFALSGTVDYDAGRLYDAWHFLREISALEVADGRMELHFTYDVNLAELNATTVDDLRFALKRLRVKPKAENADVLRVASLTVEGGPIRPLAQFGRIDTAGIDGLYVDLQRRKDGSLNWAHYFPKGNEANVSAAPAGDTAAASAPWDMLINRVTLRHIRGRFDDGSVRPAVHLALDDFNLTARHVSALPATPLAFDAALQLNKKMQCKAAGRLSHSPLDATALASCGGLDVTWFNPYIDAAADAALARHDVVLRSAVLGAAADVSAREANASVAVTVNDANATLQSLLLTPRGSKRKLAAFDTLSVTGVTASTAAKKAGVERIVLEKPQVNLRRERDGSIDATQLVKAKPAAPAKRGAAEKAQQAETPWSTAIKKIQVRSGAASFRDAAIAHTTTTRVQRFDLDVNGVTTDPSRAIGLQGSFRINGDGRVRAKGSLVPEPLKATTDFSVSGLRLKPFSPYVEEGMFVKIDDGRVGLKGQTRYRPSKRSADLRLRGDFNLNDLLVNDSRDATPLVSLKTLEAKKLLFTLSPDQFFVDNVTMGGFFSSILIDANKTLNLSTLMRPSERTAAPQGAEKTAEAAKQPFPVRIMKFTLYNGAVHFADESLPLPFDTQIHDVNGEVLGISTLPEDTTYLQVAGEIDEYGTAKAEGSLNTGDPKAFTDIGVNFRNIELKSYTPYSGKFVGRAIDSGKLSVTLRYRIVKGAMQGDNGMIINKIVLGDSIESNDSVSLPLDFAIALLEDRDGVIDIDMPVEGDVNNPKFRWGKVVWKAFVNLLTKAVTAPFDLIGSMLGIEGDSLKEVAFATGSPTVDAVARERLDMLAKVMIKRPKLAMTVQGTYDPKADTHALKQQALISEVLAQSGEDAASTENALIPKLLEPLFEKRLGKEALDALEEEIDAMDADRKTRRRIYREKLVAMMIESQPLPDGALEALAHARAAAIRNYMIATHGMEAGRITERDPEALSGEKGEVPSHLGLDAAK